MTGTPPLLVLFMGLFGGSNDPDLTEVAARIGAKPTEHDVLRTIDEISKSADLLTASAGIADERGTVESDAPPAEKLRALADLVERGEFTVERSTATSSCDSRTSPVTAAVHEVARERRPTSRRAATLLDVLHSPENARAADIRDAVHNAVDRIEAARRVEDATETGDLSRARGSLDSINDPLADAVADLLPAETERRGDASAPICHAIDQAIERVDTVDVDHDRSHIEKVEALADAAAGAETPTARAARRIRSDDRPACLGARDLLDALIDGDEESTERTLKRAVDRLNESATVRSMTEDVEREAVERRLDSVQSSIAVIDGPVADAIADRVDRLEGMLDRADESNTVIPYAIREEVEFYRDELISIVESTESGNVTKDGDAEYGDVSGAIDQVEVRRTEIESNYVEVRDDHNHSIPMYLVSFAEDLEKSAREASRSGDGSRAVALAEAAQRLLDRVEGLYERNEYSVMLRRLRG